MLFRFKDHTFSYPSKRCVLFGILNVTPDSFFDGGEFVSVEKAVAHALQLEKEGADVIDIGAESTRPGAKPISSAEELERLLPILRAARKQLKIPISVDTTKAVVAEAALNEGADIINDISSLSDPKLAEIIVKYRAGLILMHRRGTPQTMHRFCEYKNLAEDIQRELLAKFQEATHHGINPESIALDPGIGFAKTKDQNWILLRNLRAMSEVLKRPMLVGVSRKSFLGGNIQERGSATLSAEIEVREQGVQMIRTHDVSALRKKLMELESVGSKETLS